MEQFPRTSHAASYFTCCRTVVRDLLRGALEPTALSLNSAIAGPLSLRVSAPSAMTNSNIELLLMQSWSYPFLLARVSVRLPVESTCLGPDDWRPVIDSFLGNTTSSAWLDVPTRNTTKLHTVSREAHSSDPDCSRTIIVEIPVPAGVLLLPGAGITLRVSFGGSTATLRIPATGHIHSPTCNHKRELVGAVWLASVAADTAALEAALAAGGSTEEMDESKRTALLIAADSGSSEIVRTLLDSGADVNAADEDGMTPLHMAAQGGFIAVLEDLLVNPLVSKWVRDKFGRTPRAVAWERDHEDAMGFLY